MSASYPFLPVLSFFYLSLNFYKSRIDSALNTLLQKPSYFSLMNINLWTDFENVSPSFSLQNLKGHLLHSMSSLQTTANRARMSFRLYQIDRKRFHRRSYHLSNVPFAVFHLFPILFLRFDSVFRFLQDSRQKRG